MHYTGFPKDMKVVGVGGTYAIESFIAAHFLVSDGQQLKVTSVGYLGDTFS